MEVPSFRVDVSREEDLLEEIARHYGYDKFPLTLPPYSGSGYGLPHEREERRLRNLLSQSGYSETIGLAFSDEATERRFRPEVEPVRLLNPMSEEQSILRTSLVSTMLRTLQWNINRGIRDLQFYELGKIYRDGSEQRSLILAGTGALRVKSVHEAEREFNFYDIKGDVEHILEAFDLAAGQSTAGRNALSEVLYYHPGRSARAGDVAVYGELHPEYADHPFKFRQRIYLAELDVETILKSQRTNLAQPIPRFPSIRRDLSLLVNKGTRYGEIDAAITGLRIPELIHVEAFDRLESGPFPESKYSLSISLTYQSPDRTLTDEEVQKFDERILMLLDQRLGASLRK
jgi:phenylalanyl-tRNA synthetase beta chain